MRLNWTFYWIKKTLAVSEEASFYISYIPTDVKISYNHDILSNIFY